MSHYIHKEVKPGSAVITVLSYFKTYQNILLSLLIVITLIWSIDILADSSMSSNFKKPTIYNHQSGLIDWSAKMSKELDKKMSDQLQIIIIQAEESRLLETGSTQFATEESTGSQPEVGSSEADVFTHVP